MYRTLWLASLVAATTSSFTSAQTVYYDYSPVVVPAPVISAGTVIESAPSYTSAAPVVTASAAQSTSRTGQLQRILADAKQQLDVQYLPKLEANKSSLQTALSELEAFVVPESENGKRWSSFLRLPELKEQIESNKPSYVKLLDLEMNMRQNYLGLEFPQFVRLRNAVEQYAFAARFHNQEDRFIKYMSDMLDQATEQLQKSADMDAQVTSELMTIASNLYQSNQATQQLRNLRGQFSQPNIHISVDESFVRRMVSQTVARPQDVNECILGTRILGTAFMNGSVSASLLPMQNGIGIQLDLSACLTSQSRGYNRGVVINSTSSSPVLASKQVYLSEHGISSPATTVSTQLNSTIHSIEHRSRLVRRIAQKKAAEQKPQADSIAEGRMQSRVCTEFTQQVDQQVAQAQPRLTELRQRQVPELKRVGLSQPQLNLSSTDSAILAGATHAGPVQLAAWNSCPLPRPSVSGAVGEIHQSALINALATVLAGRTIRNDSLGGYVKQITGKIPDDLKDEIEGEAWSITFNTYEPVRVEFDNDLVAITVRLVRMTRGKQAQDDAVSITAKYYPQLVGNQLVLTRQGDVEVVSDKQTRGAVATTMRSFVRSKFDKTFRQSISTEPINLDQLRSRFPQANRLGLDIARIAFRLDEGWLQVAVPL